MTQDDYLVLVLPVGLGEFQPSDVNGDGKFYGVCCRDQRQMAGVARSAAVGWHAAVCVSDCGRSALGGQRAVYNQQDQRQFPTVNGQNHYY